MKLPKIPIDYSKAGSGEAPFDGGGYILHQRFEGFVSGAYNLDRDVDLEEENVWIDDAGFGYEMEAVTHYTPMPEFYEEGGE